MNTGFMGNNREFLSNRCFFCDLGEMPQHSFMTTFYPQYLLLHTISFASSPTYLLFDNFAVFSQYQYQYRYQYSIFFNININIKILDLKISRSRSISIFWKTWIWISRSRSTWPIYWKILENQYIVPSLLAVFLI